VVLEVWLLAVVVRAAGALTVVLLLLAGVIVGSAVIRRAGLRTWRNLNAAVQSGSGPLPESSGAALLMLTGLLFVLPGFASDALGLLCLLPPVRALLRRIPEWFLARGKGVAGPLGGAWQQARIHRSEGKIVQGEVVDRGGVDRGGEERGTGGDRGGPRG
jgi:UPF0716 protein FxsA